MGIAGCSSGTGGDNGYAASASPAPPPASGAQSPAPGNNKVVGVWDGTTLADCNTSSADRCNAQEDVTITLVQGEKGLTGFYRCSYKTMDCLGQNQTGNIVKASMSGDQVTTRVAMPDGTSCIYTGHTNDSQLSGGYSCYGGGALIESGSWHAKRQY